MPQSAAAGISSELRIGQLAPLPPVVAAPMCGYSDRPTREIAREMGCPLSFPPMISAEGLAYCDAKTRRLIDIEGETRPVGIQLFGSRPDSFTESARIVEEWGASLVDINMGCPARRVVGGGGGAALLKEPRTAAKIVAAARAALSIPLTVKMRAGWNENEGDARELARICEAEGADLVTLHPRSREQRFRGHSDWALIGEVKALLKIPVVGNGDIWDAADAVRMLTQTGCDAVMIGRGGLGAPWIYRDIRLTLAGQAGEDGAVVVSRPQLHQRLTCLWRHAQLVAEWRDPRYGMFEFRKHGIHYLKGVPQAKRLRAAVVTAETLEGLRGNLNEALKSIGSGLTLAEEGRVVHLFT